MNTALILLSTYNGEKYLGAQLDSLIAQTTQDWIMLIRDDGSSDNTVSIIKQYCERDSRFIFIKDYAGNVRVQQSFSLLMQQALNRSEPFIFFCDQDDVWLPNKLSLQINLLKENNGTPTLVHSDLRVVDSQLKTIHPSYLAYEKLARNTEFPLKTLLVNNYITGCTIGMNRALLTLAYPIPEHAFMHDWWCALCAAATGHIAFIAEPTILYRQHQQNTIGSSGFYGKFKDILSLKKSFLKRKKNTALCFKQANSLLTRLDPQNANFKIISSFATLKNQHLVTRYTNASALKLKPIGSIRQFIFWFFLAF